MSLIKDLFIAAHEELIEEYLAEHPNVTWDAAYDICADKAYGRTQDKLADMADRVRQRMKDEGQW